MNGGKDINEYCDYVFRELTDIKQRISKIEENTSDLSAEDKKAVSDNIFILLNELSEHIDSTLHSVVTYCPAVREKLKGAGKWAAEFHPTGKP
ncbi:MAG TPA: hypothetical protein VF790_01905 [Dissulfurispiraceae bacterium]